MFIKMILNFDIFLTVNMTTTTNQIHNIIGREIQSMVKIMQQQTIEALMTFQEDNEWFSSDDLLDVLTESFKIDSQSSKSSKGSDGVKRKKRIDTDGNVIPGRCSGYILYSKMKRKELKDADPELNPKDSMREAGAQWKQLDQDQVNDWNEKARIQNESNGYLTAKKKKNNKKKNKPKNKSKSDEGSDEHEFV